MFDIGKNIEKILKEYSDEVIEGVNKAGDKVSKKAVKSLGVTSQKRTGVYATGWKVTKETGALATIYTIHNAKKAYLPHLLEHGHANRDGSRTPGKVHIKPVEVEAIKEFEDEVKKVIENG